MTNLYIIHLALILSGAATPAAFYFLIKVASPDQEVSATGEQAKLLYLLAIFFCVIGLGASQFIPRFILGNQERPIFARYASMKILQWVMLEAAVLFLSVVFYLTHNTQLLVGTAILLMIFSLLRPTQDELLKHNIRPQN